MELAPNPSYSGGS